MGVMTTSTFRNGLEIYNYLCRPVCKEAGIQQGELDVLLFLANHPEKDTAGDVHRMGGMKQSMVSVLVEKLVQGGYLERRAIPGDRRKVKLVCTDKAAPVIRGGRAVQKRMAELIGAGISEEEAEICKRVLSAVEENILRCREQMLKGELE